MSLHLTAFWEIPNHFVINFQFCQEKVAFHWQTTCCPHSICESVLAESSVISKNIFQAHFIKLLLRSFFKKSLKIVLRWRVFILNIPNPVMVQYNKGHKYMINFKIVNSSSRFPLKPQQVLVIRNFICSLQRYCESLMLKKNELMLKKGENNLYLSINMRRIHVWKAKTNVV